MTISAEGDVSLELIGGFDINVTSPQPDGSVALMEEQQTFALIHGVSEGKLVTLVDCFSLLTRGGWFTEEPDFQRLYAQRALIGHHLQDADSPDFRRATVRIENLTSWAALPTATRQLGYTDGATTAELKYVEPAVARYLQWDIAARPAIKGFKLEQQRESHRLIGDSTTELLLTPDVPASIDSFEELCQGLTDLLTLASGQACGLISVTLQLNEDEVIHRTSGQDMTRPREVSLFNRRIHTARPGEEAVKQHQFLFRCTDQPFPDLISSWLAFRAETTPACNVYFGTYYARPGFLETRLLLLAITVESLHRGINGDRTELSREQFVELRTRLIESLTDPDEIAWVKRNLRNAPSFRDRALALAATPAAAAVGSVIQDVEQWARRLRDARNGLAHSAGAEVTLETFDLAEQTAALIALVMMAKLDLPTEVLERAASDVLRRST